jgi:hypothetical protein
MKQDLYLFSRIVAHLEFLTTYDEYGASRSRNVTTISDLAEELNRIGIVPKSGAWTKRSLECFLPRIRKRYSAHTIAEFCDCRMVGSSALEYLSATWAGELKSPRKAVMRHDSGERHISPVTHYEPIEGEKWRAHELPQLIGEARALKRLSKSKKYLNDVRTNMVSAT